MYDKDKIKQSLSIEQVFDLISELGGEPKPLTSNNIIISRTICHNLPGEGSYKLWYYSNTQLFKCYTECENDGGFDIFDLVTKVKRLSGIEDWTLYKSIIFVASYYGFIDYDYNFGESQEKENAYWSKIKNYKDIKDLSREKIVDLKIYNEDILRYLPQPHIDPWEKEGIDWNAILDRGIKYDPVNESIIIPHYNIDNRLVGVRQRTLIRENEKYGKYTPAKLNGIMYNHPLSFNLYNINNSKNNIKLIKKAIIFESEKATMQYCSYFGKENDISVAICGSSLIHYQVQLLLSLGAEELVIALDKQFKEIGDEEFNKWIKKLQGIHDKYSPYCRISFIHDKWGFLGYKDSPTDKGDVIFLELFKRRIVL
ncbi:MAG: DNA primase [Caudoviricetes sp.]|nr:MAG: DNA primase [Caudoviricetes sp.]